MREAERLLQIARAVLKGERARNGSVIQNNPQAIETAARLLAENRECWLLGVKDSGSVDREFLRPLQETGFVWHTTDKAASGGRAVDPELLNPLTGRMMTGSSSGSALNVLLGINDIALGTDGGGSVLAPALACNLYSVMLAGCGCRVKTANVSTDGIAFSASYGFIARDWHIIGKALTACGLYGGGTGLPERILFPKSGSIMMPDNTDMSARLSGIKGYLQALGIECLEAEFPCFSERAAAIDGMERLFERCDTVMTFEGPVDVYGVGDTVYGSGGPIAKAEQDKAGKYLVKVANMLGATAVTLPYGDSAAGVVLVARGAGAAQRLFNLQGKLSDKYPRNQLHDKYLAHGGLNAGITFS